MQIKRNPYNLLFFLAILLFLFGFLNFRSVIDIHLHDTFYVITVKHLLRALAVLFLLLWLLYFITKKYLYSKLLTWIHVIVTIVTCIFILSIPFLLIDPYGELAGMPRRYYDVGQSNGYQFEGELSRTVLVCAYILAGGQIIYWLNLIWGLFKHFASQKSHN